MQSEKEGVKNTSICFFINKKTAQGVFVFYSVLFLTKSKTATATPRPKRQETRPKTIKRTKSQKRPLKRPKKEIYNKIFFFVPYLDRACLRVSTPCKSRTPLMVRYLTPGKSFTRPPRTRTMAYS